MQTRGREDVPPAKAWEEAGKRYVKGGIQTSDEPTQRQQSWSHTSEKPWIRGLRLAGRVALWAVVVLLVITGLRQWFSSDPTHVQESQSSKPPPGYPEAQARATAARWAHAYLSWNEESSKEREKTLATEMAAGVDPSVGVSGSGAQDVLTVVPGEVTREQGKSARVYVTALVKPQKKKTDPYWTALEIPVSTSNGRVVVTGRPGIIGLPADSPEVAAAAKKPTDDDLTKNTREAVESFFEAWPSAEVSAITAPGSEVYPLPSNFSLESLARWEVEESKGDSRWATAEVRWESGGAEFSQEYRIQITKVSSAQGAQRWQVSKVKGGAL